jgi:septal ring factor EnvC (AmiA/AmiB activator)
VALQRGLRDLRDEVEEAREQVPKIPAIADRLTAEQKRLEAEQARLERELAKTKDRISKMRADQSIMSYGLDELRKQTDVQRRIHRNGIREQARPFSDESRSSGGSEGAEGIRDANH